MTLPTVSSRTSAAALLALSLAACGGAGSSSSDSAGGGGGTSSGTATVASASKFAFPTGTPDIRSLQATNDGVYVRLYDTGTAYDTIAKRTLGRGTTAGWLQAALAVTAGTYAPTITDNEGVDEFGIQWVGIAPGTATRRYGTTNMNNGGTSLNYLDDRQIAMIVPDGDATTTGLSWGLGAGIVYRKTTGGGIGTNFSARYQPVVNLADSGLGGYPAAADGTGYLYAASGSTLYRVAAGGGWRSWDLSSLGFGTIHTLVYRHSRLWIGYRDRVLMLPAGSDTVSSFVTLDNGFAQTALRPQFCIVGTTLYGTDGISYQGINLPSSASARPWVQGPGTVPSASVLSVTEITAAVRSGITCAGSGSSAWGPTVYATGPDLANGGTLKLFAINPR